MERFYFIFGLGNPGAEYAETRHNAGFLAVERLAQRWRAEWSAARETSAQLAKIEMAAGRVWLCRPMTFMNASGEAVGALVRYYKAALDRVLVVVDDADLPVGEIRLRGSGRSGGHHGLESIECHLGTSQYPRLRIGIGRREGEREITRHVLSRFSAEERRQMELVLDRVSRQVECWIESGLQKAMSQFNGAATAPLSKDH